MAPANDYLECSINEGHKLRVEFFKSGDRYAHRLVAVLLDDGGGETVVALAESVEGASDDPWPPSPPLQSLSIEELTLDRTAALLVGMAGRSHWSASVEAEFPPRPFVGALRFQLACRISSVPDRLGSTYRIAPGIMMRESKGCVGLAELNAGITAVFNGQLRPVLHEEAGEFYLPAEMPTPPATAQWGYIIFGQKVADPAELRKRLTA